jgi:serine/threonine protein kinase
MQGRDGLAIVAGQEHRMGKAQKVGVGTQLGRYVLIERIDGGLGGNCNVWLAEADGETLAVKVLRNTDRKERFLQEIAFLRGHTIDGTLPLIESHLDSEQNLWYAMPVATPLRKAVEQYQSAQWVIESFTTYADALTTLAESGIYHRDIKPDNLFILNGAPVLGDFGLVTYPEKDPITQPAERVGPVGYFASEMLDRPDDVEYGPADVWSLAKSLWAVLANRTFPPPGAHTNSPDFDLRIRTNHPHLAEINNLMNRCTKLTPSLRPSMAQVAAELRDYTEPPIEVQGSGTNVSALQQRIATLIQPDVEIAREAQEREHTIQLNSLEVGTHFGQVSLYLRDVLNAPFRYDEGPGPDAGRIIMAKFNHMLRWVGDHGFIFTSPDPTGRVRISYSVAAAMDDSEGPLHVGAHYHIYEVFDKLHYTLHKRELIRAVALESGQLSSELALFESLVKADGELTLRLVAETLARSPEVPPEGY